MKLLEKLPQKRILLYLAILALLPFFFLFSHFKTAFKKIEMAEADLEKATFCYVEKERRQAVNKACRHFFTKPRLSLEKELENLSFLKKEKGEIEAMLKKETFFGSPLLEKRLSFLNSQENKLKFIEIATQAKMGVQETVEGIFSPVEIDTADLKKVLSLLEGAFPQYIVLDFQLLRTLQENGSEAFLLNLKMSRREFL